MRTLKVALSILLSLIMLAIIGLFITGNSHLFRGLRYTYFVGKTGPSIDDGLKFDRDTVFKGSPQSWPLAADYNTVAPNDELMDKLLAYDPVALLVIDKDSIVYEKYWEGYSEESLSNSFSMSKSVVGMIVGVAIQDGLIESVDQKVSDFFPEFSEGLNAELTIKHLLQMSSGIEFGESYSGAFGYIAKAYYGYDIKDLTMKYRVESTPGELFKYQGGNTQLLSMIVEQESGKSLAEYFSEKVWSKIGAESDAWWTVDEEGVTRASCCLYSNTHDFARLVKLYMNKGRWGNNQIVPEAFVEESLKSVGNEDEFGQFVDYYGYQWWLGTYEGSRYIGMRGIQGQYVLGFPDRDLIIVRLGNKRSDELLNNMPIDMYDVLELGCRFDK